MPVIPATQEAEIIRNLFQTQPGENSLTNPISEKKKKKKPITKKPPKSRCHT
jgi:hypothetical protein